MTDLKEQAKKVIAKGKALNDPELIRMGLEMLDAYSGETEEQQVVMPIAPSPEIKKTNISSLSRFDVSQFTMSKAGSNVIDKSGKKQPLYTGPRENKYQDDGSDGKDILTPQIKPTERTRKSVEQQKIIQVCEVCGKEERVLPLYVRDYYRCDSCLLKGKS